MTRRGPLYRRELVVENEVVREAKARWGLESIKLNLRGNNGWPDRMFFVPGGRPFLIEFKQPGEDPSAIQIEIHKFLRQAGYDIEVHDTTDGALRALTAALQAAPVPEAGRPIPPRKRRRRSIP